MARSRRIRSALLVAGAAIALATLDEQLVPSGTSQHAAAMNDIALGQQTPVPLLPLSLKLDWSQQLEASKNSFLQRSGKDTDRDRRLLSSMKLYRGEASFTLDPRYDVRSFRTDTQYVSKFRYTFTDARPLG